MVKFCINAVPNDGKKSDACVLVFDTNEGIKSSHHSNVIILNCEKFVIDEAKSSGNWRDAFDFNEEPPQGILVTVNPGYKAGDVMSYSDGEIGADDYRHHF